jgi:hypothetical protein
VADAVHQSAFTIVAPVDPDPENIRRLEGALAQIDPVLNPAPSPEFTDFPELHYCSFVLVKDPNGPYLAFEGNVDGDVETFLHKLANAHPRWAAQIESIYRCCTGYRAGQLLAYLEEKDFGPGTWYVAFRGRSAVEIQKEAELRIAIESFLDANATKLAGLTAPELRAAIQARVRELGQEAWALDAPEKPFLVERGRSIVWGAAIGLLPITLGLLGGVLSVLGAVRLIEDQDSAEPVRWLDDPIADSEVREDRTFQNHMCSVTDIKDGWLRSLVLRGALGVVGLAHRFWFNRGDLGGIPTIHFARWLILDDGERLPDNRRKLVFFSNFDGSWERYLGDFIEQAAFGLNSIWANAKGYPRTSFLVLDGADDEERFKAFARNSMSRTRVWYSAYRDLSIQNIAANAKLREGLFADRSPDEIDEWLRLL